MRRKGGSARRPHHEGRRINKANLSPEVREFDPGTTYERPTLAAMNATGVAHCQCWCGRHYIDVPLDEIRSGRTASCGRPTCKEPT